MHGGMHGLKRGIPASVIHENNFAGPAFRKIAKRLRGRTRERGDIALFVIGGSDNRNQHGNSLRKGMAATQEWRAVPYDVFIGAARGIPRQMALL